MVKSLSSPGLIGSVSASGTRRGAAECVSGLIPGESKVKSAVEVGDRAAEAGDHAEEGVNDAAEGD